MVCIQAYDSYGQRLARLTCPRQAGTWPSLALDIHGHLVLCRDGQHVDIRRTNGELVTRFGGGADMKMQPACACVGPDGRMYVYDRQHHRVLVFAFAL